MALVEIPAGIKGWSEMNVPERADVCSFQMKRMHGIWVDQNKVFFLKEKGFVINIHFAAAGIYQIISIVL